MFKNAGKLHLNTDVVLLENSVIYLRLFLSATPPKKIQRQLYYESALLPKGTRRTLPEKIHLTLCFYGECTHTPDPPDLSGISKINVEIGEWNGFPTAGRAKVIWREVRPARPLQELSRLVDRQKNKSFVPHITVARSNFQIDTTKIQMIDTHSFIIERLTLIESQLSPGGSTYYERETYHLGR